MLCLPCTTTLNSFNKAVTAAKTRAKKLYQETGKDQRIFVYYDGLTWHSIQEENYRLNRWIDEETVKAEVFFGTGGYPEKPVFDIEYY